MKRLLYLTAFLALIVPESSRSMAREIHVATDGSDSSAGSQTAPYQTISQAAAVAQPGDIVTVHGGTYREWVKPACGGSGEEVRIVYRAAPGQEVFIKGSERVTSWTRQEGGVWRAEIPNSLFGQYNPFALNVSGGWLNYGQWHTRGDVYLNGEALYEKQTAEEVVQQEGSWHGHVEGERTLLVANFGNLGLSFHCSDVIAAGARQCVVNRRYSGTRTDCRRCSV